MFWVLGEKILPCRGLVWQDFAFYLGNIVICTPWEKITNTHNKVCYGAKKMIVTIPPNLYVLEGPETINQSIHSSIVPFIFSWLPLIPNKADWSQSHQILRKLDCTITHTIHSHLLTHFSFGSCDPSSLFCPSKWRLWCPFLFWYLLASCWLLW